MQPKCVYAMLSWLKQSNGKLTLYVFFSTAFFYCFKRSSDGISKDMVTFVAEGVVPPYVAMFMRKHLYPSMVHHNVSPIPKLII